MLYKVLHPKCTVHYAATADVAQAVKNDLNERYGEACQVSECKDAEYMIDFGGAMFAGEQPAEFRIDQFTYCIWAHQYLMTLNKLNVGLDNPRRGGYIKIHGAWTSIAMPISHAEELRNQIKNNSAELEEMEEKFMTRFEEAMSELREKGVVASPNKPKSKLDEN